MPVYDYRCNDTGKVFQVNFKTYAEYDDATITSPFTGSTNVTRIITRVGIARGESATWDRLMAGDESVLDEIDESDPATLGRALRHMSDYVGEDMGTEFHEVVDRLEAGQSPEQIEADLSPSLDDSPLVSDSSTLTSADE